MKRLLIILISFLVCGNLQSCNIFAGLSFVFSPEPEQEAMYALPNVRTVVFVDDRLNLMHPSRLKRILADEVTNQLLSEQILTTIISPQDVLRYTTSHDKHDAPIPIQSIGKAVNASTVIYIEMSYFALTNDGQTPNPGAMCNVRVIDTDQGTRLFPIEQSSYQVAVQMKRVAPRQIGSSGSIKKLTEELTIKLGEKVAKLFYKHYTGRLGENLDRK